MVLEKDFQATVIRWLKKQGCVVLKYEANATTRAGVADVFFCKEGFYGFLECKKSKNAKKRPGQQAFIDKMAEWSYGAFVYPENWDEIKKTLGEMLK